MWYLPLECSSVPMPPIPRPAWKMSIMYCSRQVNMSLSLKPCLNSSGHVFHPFLCTHFLWHLLPVLEFFMNTTRSMHCWLPSPQPFRCQPQGLNLLFSLWSSICIASLSSPSNFWSDAILTEPSIPLYLGQQPLPNGAWYCPTSLYSWSSLFANSHSTC